MKALGIITGIICLAGVAGMIGVVVLVLSALAAGTLTWIALAVYVLLFIVCAAVAANLFIISLAFFGFDR